MAAVQEFIPLSLENCKESIKPRLAGQRSILPFNLSRLGNNLHRKRSRESLDLYNPSPVANTEIDQIVSHHAKKLRIEFEEKLREKDEEIRRLGKLKLALEKRVLRLYEENQVWREEAAANSLTCRPAVEEDAESCCGSNDAV